MPSTADSNALNSTVNRSKLVSVGDDPIILQRFRVGLVSSGRESVSVVDVVAGAAPEIFALLPEVLAIFLTKKFRFKNTVQ